MAGRQSPLLGTDRNFGHDLYSIRPEAVMPTAVLNMFWFCGHPDV